MDNPLGAQSLPVQRHVRSWRVHRTPTWIHERERENRWGSWHIKEGGSSVMDAFVIYYIRVICNIYYNHVPHSCIITQSHQSLLMLWSDSIWSCDSPKSHVWVHRHPTHTLIPTSCATFLWCTLTLCFPTLMHSPLSGIMITPLNTLYYVHSNPMLLYSPLAIYSPPYFLCSHFPSAPDYSQYLYETQSDLSSYINH